MKINRALGLGLALIVLQLLASDIWTSLEATIIRTLDISQIALGAAEKGIEQMPTFPSPSLLPSP